MFEEAHDISTTPLQERLEILKNYETTHCSKVIAKKKSKNIVVKFEASYDSHSDGDYDTDVGIIAEQFAKVMKMLWDNNDCKKFRGSGSGYKNQKENREKKNEKFRKEGENSLETRFNANSA